ncbi:unnamed protein product [Polarella glacialis]|uniref:Uncharacterized protein n=1 Tax=Polarella glacialis TaxID=89957 RepID=A0A813GW78_POLGL|nr:unnamed protein product [Polarella glacialis]CAE8674725.1 unnamed protein product [Polarella glacialis]
MSRGVSAGPERSPVGQLARTARILASSERVVKTIPLPKNSRQVQQAAVRSFSARQRPELGWVHTKCAGSPGSTKLGTQGCAEAGASADPGPATGKSKTAPRVESQASRHRFSAKQRPELGWVHVKRTKSPSSSGKASGVASCWLHNAGAEADTRLASPMLSMQPWP